MHQLDPFRCADELFSFATTFSKFNFSQVTKTDKAEESESNDGKNDSTDDMNKGYGAGQKIMVKTTNHSDNPLNKMPSQKKDQNKINSFIDALRLLSSPDCHLVDAYPTLCQVYAIAVAIPISSASAERSFSALKRVKTRIRSTMVQDRLESLLVMMIERKILLSLNKDEIINAFAKTSSQLTKALI